jgi:hypothetical protein
MRCKRCNNQTVREPRLAWKASGGSGLFLAALCPACGEFLKWVAPRSQLAAKAPPKPESVEINRELF